MLADHVAQTRQRHLLHGHAEVLDLQHGSFRIADAEPEHRVDLHRDAVARNGFLRLNRIGDRAQVDTRLVLDSQRDQPEEAGAALTVVAAKAEDNRRFIFAGDAEARDCDNQDEGEEKQNGKFHGLAIIQRNCALKFTHPCRSGTVPACRSLRKSELANDVLCIPMLGTLGVRPELEANVSTRFHH